MRTISVDRVHLRDRVSAAKIKHITEYAMAMKKYREAVAKQASAMAKHAASKSPMPKYGYRIEIDQPINRRDEFDRILAQLDASTDVNITLDEHEFDRLWRGRWEFADEIKEATASYIRAARAKF